MADRIVGLVGPGRGSPIFVPRQVQTFSVIVYGLRPGRGRVIVEQFKDGLGLKREIIRDSGTYSVLPCESVIFEYDGEDKNVICLVLGTRS